MKKGLIISGVGGALFPYLMNVLDRKYNLVMVDSNTTLKKIYPGRNIYAVPPVVDESYESVIEKMIARENIQFYIPLIDEEIPKAHAIAARNKELKLIAPDSRFVQLCLDKYKIMRELSKQNISEVKTFQGNEFDCDINWPILVKPRIGRGSRGVRKIENAEQFHAYFVLEGYNKDDVIVQEYLDGAEYSVSVVANNLNKLISVVPKLILTKRGITVHAVTEKNEAITEVCKDIVNKLRPSGPLNVQLMVVDGNIRIFEINPRFSTTSILTCESGINEFEMCMETYNREEVEYIDSFRENLHLYRRWKSCFYEK